MCLIVKKYKKAESKPNASLKETIEKASTSAVVVGTENTEKPNPGDRASRAKKRREAKEALIKMEEDKNEAQ